MTNPIAVITGATGLIGAELTRALRGKYEVHCVSRNAPTQDDVRWHALDLASKKELSGLPARADTVIYLAQSEFFRDFPEHSEKIFQVNTGNLLTFLAYARDVRATAFLYASSGGVYGGGDAKMSEEVQIPARGDLGFYVATKLCSEILVQTFSQFFNVVILRFFFVYGPSQRDSMLIPRLIKRVRAGEPITLQGSDGIRITPTYVSDAVDATKRALGLKGSYIINVAGPEILTIRQIGTFIGNAVGREPLFTVDHETAANDLAGDITRMRDLLCAPSIRFSQGLEMMLKKSA